MCVGLTSCQQPSEPTERADPKNVEQVAMGRIVYNQHCASCHGANLEGQPNWRKRRLDGRLPAPPHDRTGHTWEHPDDAIFRVTKQGFQAFAGPQYETDMPGFGNVLSDDQIWAVIAYMKSRWPQELLERRRPKKPSAAHEAHVSVGSR
ncbi:MAG: c-type cytochrome [Bosea sp.]|uniref:c-type cytochrome n=2 Tax=Bosea sp. (in: a-proteobacteria) TaxID=1871050 RepID=UPI002389E95E|nr:c-type cytochrome [Bosea sp. (in: a-proteobacteria)]MCP4736753.1 c-type cytochrome [Bosea sp. (in: a-proteobacteria)]